MLKNVFEALKLSVFSLTPCALPIYGFGVGIVLMGAASLLTNLLIVVECPSAYNLLIGQPTLSELDAIVSYNRLIMKFSVKV